MMGLKIIVAALALAGAAMIAGIAMIPSPEKELPPVDPPPVNVEVSRIVPRPELDDHLDMPGVVEPFRIVRVSSEATGRIESVEVEEGDTTVKDQPLIRLNTDILEAELAQAKAQANYDQAEYERMARLRDQGAVTEKQVDDLAARAEVSAANLQLVEARFDRAVVRAPSSGVINRLAVEEGEYVAPGSLVAEIVEISRAKVLVHIPERDLPFFSTGMTALVFTQFREEPVEMEGEIIFIGNIADPLTRTTPVEIILENANGQLASGRIVRARLLRRTIEDAIMVPLDAVIPLEDGAAVFVVEDGEAQRREVDLGLIRGRMIQITTGLEPEDRLIVKGHRLVSPGQAVRVTKED